MDRRSLAADVVDILEQGRRQMRGENIPPKQRRHLQAWMIGILSNPNAYSEFEYRNGKLVKAIVANPQRNDFGEKVVRVLPFVWERAQKSAADFAQMQTGLKRIVEHCRTLPASLRPKWIEVLLLPHQRDAVRQMERVGARLDFHELYGKVQDAKKWLIKNQNPLTASYSLSKMNFEREISEVLRFETAVHAMEKTSRVRLDSRVAVERMREHYKRSTKRPNSVYLLRDRKKLVGLVCVNLRNNIGMIGSISVATSYQSQGIGKRLYLTAIETFERKNVEFWAGGSSTASVLHLAEKMKRTKQGSGWLIPFSCR